VPLLQQSVDTYRAQGRTSEIGYAYALYNLGRALNRSGQPDAAIPILEERLRFRNQRATVQAELRSARRAAGQA